MEIKLSPQEKFDVKSVRESPEPVPIISPLSVDTHSITPFLLTMLLGLPITMIIKAVCDHVKGLKPIGELLGD